MSARWSLLAALDGRGLEITGLVEEHRVEVRTEALGEAGAELLRIADETEARVAEHYGAASGIGPGSADMVREAARTVLAMIGEKTTAAVLTAPACAACQQPFDPTGWRHDERARHRDTPFCRSCVDRCHDSESADHRCPVCRAAEEKTTAPVAAAVTPQPATGWHAARDLTGRLGPLLAHIRTRPDHTWIPSDVHRLDRPEAKEPCTCSRDLEALATLGWLVERQEPGRRVFVYNSRKDGQR